MTKLSKYQMVAALLNNLNAASDEDVKSVYETVIVDGESLNESIDVAKEVEALFEGAKMTDELKDQTIAIFEVAVADATNTKIKKIEEDFTSTFDAAVVKMNEENSENINKYLSYVIEQWIEKNSVGIDNILKVDIAESFLGGMKDLYKKHNINITEDEYNANDELTNKVAELEAKLNEEINSKIELKATIAKGAIKEAFDANVTGLADTEVERLAGLMEAFDISDVEVYVEKLKIVKESYFPNSKSKVADITEESVKDETKPELKESAPKQEDAYSRYLDNN